MEDWNTTTWDILLKVTFAFSFHVCWWLSLFVVKRARVALSYLENSVDDASTETGLAYALLAKHFFDNVRPTM